MLYITTRDDKDAYTAHRALNNDVAPDGGRYVPFRMPRYSETELLELAGKPFNEIVADILNQFFSLQLSGWDIEVCMGKNFAKLAPVNHRVVVAESWHNFGAAFDSAVKSLQSSYCTEQGSVSDWLAIATRIASLFGIYGQMLQQDQIRPKETMDISVPASSLCLLMAAWYARQMGLPVETIICTGELDSSLWDFVHKGVVDTKTLDAVSASGMERLIHGAYGCDAVSRFNNAVSAGRIYTNEKTAAPVSEQGVFCAVTGENRAGATINSIYRSNSYIVDPTTALCYAGLQDYRAKTGAGNLTLLVAEESPLRYRNEITAATGINAQKLTELINRS